MAVYKTERPLENRVKGVFESNELAKIYANGFIIFLGQADIGIILEQNTRDVAVLNMSYTLAKTLAEKLGNTVREFEEKTDTIIMTTDAVREKTMTEQSDAPQG